MTTITKAAKSATIIMILTLASRFLGFIREMLIANRFGASMETDAYFIAFTAATFVVSIIVVALSTTLIPILSEIESKDGVAGKNRYFNNLINIAFVGLFSMMILGFIFAPQVVRVLAKGFDGEQFQLAVLLMRIGLPIVILLGMTNIFTAYLHNNQKFTAPAAVGFPYNAVFILFLVLISYKFGIKGLMVASIIAVASQLLILIPPASLSGYRFSFKINLKDKYLRKNLVLVGPIILGVMAGQVNLIVDRTLASTLVTGSISALNFASRVNGLVIGLFVTSIVTVLFPMLSKNVSEGDYETLKTSMRYGVNIIVVVTLPIIIGILLLATPIVNLLFERGAFDAVATEMTAVALVYYSLGLVGIGISILLQRVYFAMQDTKTPMFIGVIAVAVNIALNLLLVDSLEHGGLALATSISASLSAILLLIFLKMKLGQIGARRIIKCFVKVSVASVIMGVVVYYMFKFSASVFYGTAVLNAISLTIAVVVGVLTYFIICYALKIEEVRLITSKFVSVVVARVGRIL